MNWIKRLFSKKEKEVQKQEVKRTITRTYDSYRPSTSRKSSYEPSSYQANRKSDNDLLDPLNPLSPLSPISPISIWNNDDNYNSHSHDSGSSSHDCGSSSSDWGSSSFDSSSSYDTGSSCGCD